MVDVLSIQEWIYNFLTGWKHHKKGTKVERRKNGDVSQIGLQYI
jgi:hypothetical protein